jgi:pimeloyl-ACP methyl ester carboxylesterase
MASASIATPPATRRSVTRDGVALAYTDTGVGTPPFMLVHGLCDDLDVMAPLARRLAGDHRVVRVDLRGHGASDAPEGGHTYTVETLAADVAAVCDHLGVDQAVVVGHSLGGAVAVQLAATLPDLVAGVVLLEGALLFRGEVLDGVGPLLAAIRTPAWRDALHGFVDGGFIATDDPVVRAAAHARVDGLAQHAMASIFDAAGRWDAEPAIRAVGVPMLYVEAGSGLTDLARFTELCPQLQIGRTVGVGHNQMLATPAQAKAMIGRFVEVSVAGAA